MSDKTDLFIIYLLIYFVAEHEYKTQGKNYQAEFFCPFCLVLCYKHNAIDVWDVLVNVSSIYFAYIFHSKQKLLNKK